MKYFLSRTFLCDFSTSFSIWLLGCMMVVVATLPMYGIDFTELPTIEFIKVLGVLMLYSFIYSIVTVIFCGWLRNWEPDEADK